MLPSSVRRVVTTAPQSPVVASFAAATVPRAAGVFVLGHQRRYSSSSKPSRTDSGSKEIGARQSVPSSSASKASGEKRKRKASTAKDAAATTPAAPPVKPLPSVPSTQHISQEALGLTTFFSLHRPISVKHSFPRLTTEEQFAEIFAERTKASPKDVLSTLSKTVKNLERPLARMNLENTNASATAHGQVHAEEHHDADGNTRIDLRHPDGSETSVYVQLNTMSGSFLPFRPPPIPEPQTAAEAEAEAEAAAAADLEAAEPLEPQTRTYKAILTIEETVDADGQFKVTAHSPTLVEEGAVPRTFLERMALRQMQWEDARQQRQGQEPMMAISVRRQKKLKIKKKKYKKLLRRTRNERRKLDR